MKSFFNLVQEVLKPGLCSRCGGCVVFCRAAGFNALDMGRGKPTWAHAEKCIECGLCYSICPETCELDDEIKEAAAWETPIGRVINITVARAADSSVRKNCADGGVLAAMLVLLYDLKRIDSVVLAMPEGRFLLFTKREDIFSLAGFLSKSSLHGGQNIGFKGIESIDPAIQGQFSRVALVGTPCRIKSYRKMQLLNLVPSNTVAVSLGLFCSGHGRGEACRFCPDFSSEFADISLGRTGAENGWSTLIVRTDLGRSLLADGLKGGQIEQPNGTAHAQFASRALEAVRKTSSAKKKKARHNRRSLKNRPVKINI